MRIFATLTIIISLFSDNSFGITPAPYEVNSCNFAPYPVHLHWVLPDINQFGQLSLKAGECKTINALTPKQNNYYKNIRLYAEAASSDSFDYLRNKPWYIKTWSNFKSFKRGKPAQWPGYQKRGIFYCAVPNTNDQYQVNSPNQCDQGKSLRLYSSELQFDKTGRADWIILDFAICEKLTDLDCYGQESLADFSIWAMEMNLALQRLYKIDFYTYERVGLIPTHAGIEVRDTNRMFNEGVEVISALKSTPFGTPIQLQKGDEILSFNGNKVFGRELIMLVFEAGKRFGYHHANDVIFRRNGQAYSTKIALYFDENIYGPSFQTSDGSCRMPVLTAALSALNEFLFYKQTTITCLNNGLTAQKYDSFGQCKFERDQFLAASRQFCPKAEYTGALIGGLSFAGRNFIEKAAIKHIPGIGGKKLYSRILLAALLEAAEESIRAALTEPPGLSTKVILNDIVARGKLQGAIGVGFQVVPLITAGALVPIIYNSYQDL